ncbi:hypothetical protein DPMN_159356 [Dreissena polymorpha]|uniref:Uncharacterized protein n=1 Tax=Dreissena polymorpha TaxID=45954 RepID=A0A9D4EKL2_DREPO|nr:hypothetical protein DPMN_159356 [Dreissena polymorpha]
MNGYAESSFSVQTDTLNTSSTDNFAEISFSEETNSLNTSSTDLFHKCSSSGICIERVPVFYIKSEGAQ